MFNIFSTDIIQHLGYIFTFLALSIKDVLWLRIVLAMAQLTLGVYQFITVRYDVVLWNFIFTCVNIYHITRILNERKPVKIPVEIQDLYNNLFNKMTSKEFTYFWNLGELFTDTDIKERCLKIGEQTDELLFADECPTGTM